MSESSVEKDIKTSHDSCKEISNYSETEPEVKYTPDSSRWYVLLVLSLLILSISMSRMACSPVSYTSATFYQVKVQTVNWFAIIYMIVGFPCGIITPWIIQNKGLRFTLISSSWLGLIGGVLRVLSAIGGVDRVFKLILILTGHIFSGVAQSFLMFTPSVLAASWFNENQRTLANSIASISNPLGVLIAFNTSPFLLKSPDDMMFLHAVNLCPIALGTFLATFGIRRSNPKIPPSASAEIRSLPLKKSLKKLFSNKKFWLLSFSLGGSMGIFTILTALLEQILCPWGYSSSFAGLCGTCLIASGVLGATIIGALADRIKVFATLFKIIYILTLALFGVLAFFQNHENAETIIITVCCLLGFFGVPLLPLGNELSVEITFPVNPSISSGILFLAGQLQGMILFPTLRETGVPLTEQQLNVSVCNFPTEKSRVEVDDLSNVCYFMFGYNCILTFIILFLKPEYRRQRVEDSTIEK